MTRVLVTGGAGFVGRNLAQRLLDEFADVSILDNLSSPSPLGPPSGAEFHEGTVIDPPQIPGRFDLIFHLASLASPPRYLAAPIDTLRSGAEGTRHMLDRAERDGAVFVLASTSEIYGEPLEHPQSEAYAGNVDVTSIRSCYDEAKRYAEAITYAYRRTGRVPETRVARIFNTYGPGMAPDDGRVVTNLLIQGIRREALTLYGDGSQTRSFCYVDDLVEGLILLAQSDTSDPVNLGNPHEISITELADVVGEMTGAFERTYEELPQSDPTRRRPDITRARTLLGWEPRVSLVDGLALTADYLRSVTKQPGASQL